MLQSIREKSQGWLAWVIVGLISIPFALWGINSYFDGTSNVSVAEVNGKEISLTQFQNGMQTYRQQLQGMFGADIDINSLDQNLLKQTVIDGIVDKELIRQTGEESGMRVSDTQLVSLIQSLNAFQDESGRFSNEIYESRLRQSGLTPPQFQQEIRQEILQGQLQQGISGSAFITPKEREKIEQLQQQQRSIIYTVIDAEPLKKTVSVSDNEIKDYYEKNKEFFKTEASVSIEYVDLSVAQIAKNIEATDDELEEYYQANLDKYSFDERRVANHIFVSIPPEASEEHVAKSRASAEKLLTLVKEGINFDDIPARHDHLLGDSDEVGKTGEVTRGIMGPEFDEALFSLKKDEVSDLVRGEEGFHIIKPVEIKPAEIRSFTDVKPELEQQYKLDQAQQKYYDIADELQNLTFENPDTLEVAAEELGLEIKKNGSFTQSTGAGVSEDAKVRTAAFSKDVLDGNNSEPVELSDERLIVLRSEDYKEARIKPLDDVKEQISTSLKSEKAKKLAEERGQALLAKLKEGTEPAQLAKEESFEWTEKKSVSRDDPQVQRAILRSAFKMGKPDGKPIYSGAPMGFSDYAVIGVLDVLQPDEENEESTASIETQLESLKDKYSKTAWEDFVSTLKKRSEIKVNSDAL